RRCRILSNQPMLFRFFGAGIEKNLTKICGPFGAFFNVSTPNMISIAIIEAIEHLIFVRKFYKYLTPHIQYLIRDHNNATLIIYFKFSFVFIHSTPILLILLVLKQVLFLNVTFDHDNR